MDLKIWRAPQRPPKHGGHCLVDVDPVIKKDEEEDKDESTKEDDNVQLLAMMLGEDKKGGKETPFFRYRWQMKGPDILINWENIEGKEEFDCYLVEGQSHVFGKLGGIAYREDPSRDGGRYTMQGWWMENPPPEIIPEAMEEKDLQFLQPPPFKQRFEVKIGATGHSSGFSGFYQRGFETVDWSGVLKTPRADWWIKDTAISEIHILPENIRPEIGRAVQQECRDRSRMPSSA
eukprot:TRINITY_DN10649_c0_g1_i11.p1 TRINITY_DN10649_c0_g1~~TRINITY_DN10649_c0_g1_i11.p1  ORF type:complete len:241 (-),score=49.51 TRINITY_DN10649_c0_g1_i11:23-721(-)